MGTPMKFTRSLPAKANARANVPSRILIRRMLMRKSCINASTTVHTTQQIASEIKRWSLIHAYAAVSASTPFSALNTAK